MRFSYRILAYLIALAVLVQAGAIAFALVGLGAWIRSGEVLDKAAWESESAEFTGIGGFMIHSVTGEMVMPLLAVLLLVVSFFARVRGGVGLAAMLLGGIVVQVLTGMFGHDIPMLGWVHGMFALVIFWAAIVTARRAESDTAAGVDTGQPVADVG